MVCHIVLTGTVVCEATRWSVTLFLLGLLCVRPQDGLSHCSDWDCCV